MNIKALLSIKLAKYNHILGFNNDYYYECVTCSVSHCVTCSVSVRVVLITVKEPLRLPLTVRYDPMIHLILAIINFSQLMFY